jgi:aminopeptidase
VWVTGPHGTDFQADIEGRDLLVDDGLWSAEKEASGDWGANLPAGEVFVAPVETAGECTIVCPLTADDLTRSTVLRDVRLYFKDGTLVPEKCTAGKGEDMLLDNLKKFVDIDMDKRGSPNALKIAELGIGMNPIIDRAIGYIPHRREDRRLGARRLRPQHRLRGQCDKRHALGLRDRAGRHG